MSPNHPGLAKLSVLLLIILGAMQQKFFVAWPLFLLGFILSLNNLKGD